LACHRGELIWQPTLRRAEPIAAPVEQPLQIQSPGLYRLPDWGGALRVSVCEVGGVAPQQLISALLRSRQGGEQFQRAPLTPPRSLKKQFQTAGVPAWQRDAPLLWAEGQLLWVAGLGVDARHRAEAGAPQWQLEWLPDAHSAAVAPESGVRQR
jgi:tRNA(Ile)-lysidine synthase